MSDASAEQLHMAAAAIRNDRVHGAMELAVRAVEAAVALLERYNDLHVPEVGRALATTRPSMAAIANAVVLTLAPFVANADRSLLRERAERRIVMWRGDEARLHEHAPIHIPRVILTYSHASITRSNSSHYTTTWSMSSSRKGARWTTGSASRQSSPMRESR